MAGTITSSEARVELRERYLIRTLPRDSSLSRGCEDTTGARAYNLVEARLLLRAVVLAVNIIFHHVWQAVRGAMPFHR